jgi:ClpP class serine protease
MVVGNADDLMEQATLLEKIGEQLKQVYVRATGKDEEEVKRWMTGETWFNAQEALDAGLVTGIKDSVKAAASMIKDFDTSAFKHTPKSFLQLVEEPEEPITTPEPEAPKVILTPLRNYWEQRIGASHYSRNTK